MSGSLVRVLAAWIAASVLACATAPRRAGAPVHAAGRPEQPVPMSAQRLQVLDAAAARPPGPPELFVRCEARANCPSGVGMLVVESGDGEPPERCTVALIAADRAVTASHCIASADRHAGASCARTWVLFPETADAPAEWVGCQRIVYAAGVANDALHQEHAVLQLAHAVGRTPLAIDPAPPDPGSIVTVVSVTPHPVYDTTHALSARLCRAIDAAPAEQALGPAAANVGWLASCPVAHGNSGSPVLDYAGQIRAIVHGGTSLISAFAVTSTLSQDGLSQ